MLHAGHMKRSIMSLDLEDLDRELSVGRVWWWPDLYDAMSHRGTFSYHWKEDLQQLVSAN